MIRLALYRRPFALLAAQRRDVIVGTACVPIAALLALVMPVIAGRTLDLALRLGREGGASWLDLALGCAGVLVAGVGGAALRFAARRKLIDASRRVEERLKNDLVAHLQRLPAAWFDRARTGDVISRLTQDVELLRFVVGPALLHGGAALVILPGGCWLMASLSVKVFVTVAVAFGLLLAAMVVLMPRLHRDSTEVQETIGAISQRAAEAFAGIRVLMTFGRGRDEAAAMAAASERYLDHNVRLTRTRALLDLFIHTSRDLVILAVLVVGVLEALAGRLTLGELFQFLLLSGAMVWPLISTSWVVAALQRSVAAAERVEELFAAEPERPGGRDVQLQGRLEVRNLTFAYPGQDRPALEGVSFAVDPGQKVGVVGPVGAGKSTLLALLLRLYEPPPGTVFVDGHDVRELEPTALRRVFAAAPQEPFLFSDTIRGNVAFGAASGARHVEAAIHASALDQDLEHWPEGLESLVGERGITLSGGQKQRVSLARALAAERGALVLDDTLSAVDHRTETVILERLRRARAGRTMLVASHRLSAVADADLILVLDRGRVVERGRHADLLRRSGYYAAAWSRQRERDALEGRG